MDQLKLLIVDDTEDNGLSCKTICQQIEGFDIQNTIDGTEAIEIVQRWHPHIVLIDCMMLQTDSFEISKMIKRRDQNTVVIAATSEADSQIQGSMDASGVDIYIDKLMDQESTRHKLQSVGSSLRLKRDSFKDLSRNIVVNPFNPDIHFFKTIFDIVDTDAMMDFGIWLSDQYSLHAAVTLDLLDKVLDIFYMLVSQCNKADEAISIIVEEGSKEFYVTIQFNTQINLEQNIADLLDEFAMRVIIQDNVVYLSLNKALDKSRKKTKQKMEKPLEQSSATDMKIPEQKDTEQQKQDNTKEVRVIHSDERELLHQSFVNKTSAIDYVNEIGGDVLEEIRELSSLDEEWNIQLRNMEEEPTAATFAVFADNVLGIYVKTINNLFEFTALAYALSSLGTFIKESADTVSQDASKVKTLIMLLEHLGTDLTSWREHIFVLQDTADIHYLDSSFFSSCVQIEGIISDKHIGDDDDNDMEFF